MDIKELRKHYNKAVRYDHKGLDPIYPVLQGILLHEVNGYEVFSAVLLDSTGTAYQALPHEISEDDRQ